MKNIVILICISFIVLLGFSYQAHAFMVINEFLADPPPGELGDVNGDGVRSSTDDEFIEILNFGDSEVLLSDWYISDAVGVRFVFDAGITLAPYACLLIFGGGTPTGFDVLTLTAGGALSLNNDGDSISLFDSNDVLIDFVLYGPEGGNNQSLSRYPDGAGDFYPHAAIPGAEGALYSPGRMTNGQPFASPAVPEPQSMLLFGAGILYIVSRGRKGVCHEGKYAFR